MTTKEEVKKLWKICFEDSEEFTELYFNYRYHDDINMLIRDEEQLISALQMIPYPMTLLGEEIDTAYISGACTDPAYRGQGVMRALLSLSFERMIKNNIPISTLIPAEPWLFDYYKRMGYQTIFNYSIHEIEIPALSIATSAEITIQANTDYEEAVYNYLSLHMKKRTCYVQHTCTDYKVILADLKLSGGNVLTAYQRNEITAIAIVEPVKETLLIKELVSESLEIANALLKKASDLYHPQKIDQISPPSEGYEIHPLGMARIIDAREILKMYAAYYPEKKMNLQLTDDQLPYNNGYYNLADGKCTYSDNKIAEPEYRMSANELTIMVFSSLEPYMNLMLN